MICLVCFRFFYHKHSHCISLCIKSSPDRNLLARFTVVSTQECRSLEEIHEQGLLLDMRPSVENGVQTMEVLLRMAWLHAGKCQHGVQVDVTWDSTRLLNAAHNAMKRAAVMW